MAKKSDSGALSRLERRLEPLLAAGAAAKMPARGWLRAFRDALGFSQAQIARKIGVKRQSYAQFEAAEERGSISIGSLRRAAKAMDCDFSYFIVPRAAADRTFGALAELHDSAGRTRETAPEKQSDVLPVDLL